jgi:hypothetical protein
MTAISDAPQKKKHPYYSFDKIYSYNAMFMFVCGGRGLGKTYGAKKKAIRAALDKDDQFIYLRRFKDEMKARNTFFADIQWEFPDWEFRINGNQAEASYTEFKDEKKRPWKVIGYFIPLSTAQSQKSTAYPNVKLIIFDEFIIEKGLTHYLPDEANVFNNFYSTVDRWQDKTRVLFLANSVSIMNPYFLEYDIKPDEVSEYDTKYDGFIAVHFADSKEFANSVYQTKFGKFIKNSSYADYAVGNGFQDNNDHLLQLKDEKARYQYTVVTQKGSFSVWYNVFTGNFFAQKRLPKYQITFVLDPDLMKEDRKLLLRSDGMMQMLRSAFSSGILYFDEPVTRNAMIEIFKR